MNRSIKDCAISFLNFKYDVSTPLGSLLLVFDPTSPDLIRRLVVDARQTVFAVMTIRDRALQS